MPQEIVFYHSAQTGAPSGTLNSAGALLAVLDACLVNGFNVNSISTLTQAAGVATATTSGTNGFNVGEWVEVSGATPTAYNGRVKVTGKPAANQFTYAVPGGTASPASGTMTAKYPGAGWLKTSGGTNIAAYQGGAGSLGLWMQVEDNNPYADGNLSIRTRMAAGWTALDTATVLSSLQVKVLKLTGGWMVFADHKTVYLFFGNIAGGGGLYSFSFGETAPFFAGDAYSMFQSLGESAAANPSYNEAGSSIGTSVSGRYWPFVQTFGSAVALGTTINLRGVSQVGGYVPAYNILTCPFLRTLTVSGSVGHVMSQDFFLPSLADNGIPVAPIFNGEFGSPNHTLRGRYRGVFWPLGGLSGGFTNSFQRLDAGLIDGVSQPLVLVNSNQFAGGATSLAKQLAFKVDGTWD